MWSFKMISDAAFIAGIDIEETTGSFHFDKAIWNPGGHFNSSEGSYHIPFKGMYQFTITLRAHNDFSPKFRLFVDGSRVAYMRNYDNDHDDNSLIMTRNLHLETGQVITVDVSDMNGVRGEYSDGKAGYYSWFQGHLIYAD